jgi:hypothetical protein
MQNMQVIAYKMEYSILEFVFGLIGPAIILISIFYPIPDMRIGTLWLHLPPGVANGLLGVFGAFVTSLTVATLCKKHAANNQGARIVIDETKMTFTTVQKFRGVLTVVDYDAIEKITFTHNPPTDTSIEEKIIEISMPSLRPKKFEFDVIHMAKDSDFDVLLHTLKFRTKNATFEVN